MLFDRLLREDILQKLTAVQQGGFLSQSRGGGQGTNNYSTVQQPTIKYTIVLQDFGALAF